MKVYPLIIAGFALIFLANQPNDKTAGMILLAVAWTIHLNKKD